MALRAENWAMAGRPGRQRLARGQPGARYRRTRPAVAGAPIAVVQLAGLLARRFVCFVREGQPGGAGERFGMIRFGSRLDVYLPEGTAPQVAIGQTSLAGETVLADLLGKDAGRAFRSG